MNTIRREKIREYLHQKNAATLDELSALLPEVSLMTIHRDLSYLQSQGLVQKVRGGARYVDGGASEPAFSAREIVNKRQKQEISEKAMAFLYDTNSIFIDAGTTMTSFAKMMPDLPIHIVTTSPNIALELVRKRNPVVDLCGGTLNKLNLTLSGSAAVEMISHINIDTAFLVASGYSEECGFTCGIESEARIKSLIIEKARRTVILMDTSKLGRLLPYTFGRLSEVDFLITELDPSKLPDKLQICLADENVSLI